MDAQGSTDARVGVIGGTGFLGRHLAAALGSDRAIVASRRTGVDVDDATAIATALGGCDVVVQLAGINREIGEQTYRRVHVGGAAAAVDAARLVGARRIVLVSHLRAGPGSASAYHQSKWEAEQIVRGSGIEHAILRPGIVYGAGDHLVGRVARMLAALPIAGSIGVRDRVIRPVEVGEVVAILRAAIDGELPNRTVPVVGGEAVRFSKAVRRIGAVIGRRVVIVPTPLWSLRLLASSAEAVMREPFVTRAQIGMLAESDVITAADRLLLPEGLRPVAAFDADRIRASLASA